MKHTLNNSWCEALLLLLLNSLIGCSRSISITESDRYNDQMVDVHLKDGVIYKLGSGWKVDSLHNLYGRGLKVVSDSSEQFKGMILASDVEQLVIVDSLTPAVIICAGAVVALSSIWLALGNRE